MTALTDENVNDSSTDSSGANALASLPNAQAFSRDAEDYTKESVADTIRRIKPLMERRRKARQDDAEIADLATKTKKANAASAKTKAKKQVKPLSLDTII